MVHIYFECGIKQLIKFLYLSGNLNFIKQDLAFVGLKTVNGYWLVGSNHIHISLHVHLISELCFFGVVILDILCTA